MLQQILDIAGIEIIEAKISHLVYSSEIAQAMLRCQQAHAITSARKHIV
ncbi:membrane protease domain protein [Wolbachia endosymbiont of Brugia pahangi]|nr:MULTISPECIES: SPFH domain-containing protein [unclassified Wolbachia]QIT35712.1 membrane protease domain protein [Wolbachia endosymbiont of Brugia pahangi]